MLIDQTMVLSLVVIISVKLDLVEHSISILYKYKQLSHA